MKAKNLKLEITCESFPEQYDVWYGDTKVGYIRFRSSILEVHPYINHEIDINKMIFTKNCSTCALYKGDSGTINSICRYRLLEKCKESIAKYHNRRNNIFRKFLKLN